MRLSDEVDDDYYQLDTDYDAFAASLSTQLNEAIAYQAIERQHSPIMRILQHGSFTSNR